MKVTDFFSTFRISSSGMSAEKKQLSLIAENIANANTTRTAAGTPYRRKVLVRESASRRSHFSTALRNATLKLQTTMRQHIAAPNFRPRGVDGDQLTEIKTEVEEVDRFRKVYDPSHPDADKNGIVRYPDINVVNEMVELISSSRAYEANVTMMNATKNLVRRALEI
ncbi:MAG: flagellar basal body rod protein FlgC [Calditrichaeota bacterium]|nr:MAG: flagellar basal body rod protein FlgC [Calditrichota bacterium]